MNFKIGDKVQVVDENSSGLITKISGNQITILDDETEFETTYSSFELIKVQSLNIDSVEVKDSKTKPKTKISKPLETKEIDLHIGHLVDSFSGLSNAEMLAIQKHTIHHEIGLAIAEKRKRLIFIHGHGKGVLKQELYKILNQYKNQLHFFDANFQRFKLGATEVEFFS